jgi:hypothetical protein
MEQARAAVYDCIEHSSHFGIPDSSFRWRKRGKSMKIMVFLQGTILMHRSGLGQPREERVRQVLNREKSIYDWASYVPIGDAVKKLRKWKAQGAEIIYLSSHKKSEDIRLDEIVLRKYGFPDGTVFFRRDHEEYKDVAERVRPDILIDDDCESIGGEKEMTYPHIKPDLQKVVKSVVVQEFDGIDHLPDEISALISRL